MPIDLNIKFSPYNTRPASKQEQREQHERYLDELRDAFIEMQRRLADVIGKECTGKHPFMTNLDDIIDYVGYTYDAYKAQNHEGEPDAATIRPR